MCEASLKRGRKKKKTLILRQQSSDTDQTVGLDLCNEGNKQDIKIKNNQEEGQGEFILESAVPEYYSEKGPWNLGPE